MLDFQAARYLIKGEVAGQEGNDHPTGTGTGMFQTADGYINIAAAGDARVDSASARRRARPSCSTHPDYATPAARSKNRTALNARAGRDRASSKPNDYWVKLLDKAGVPCGPINTIDKVFADPQVQHLGIATPIDHPKYGPQKVVGQPIHLSRYPQPEKLKHTPEHGRAHRRDTEGLGYDEAAIAALREKRAV